MLKPGTSRQRAGGRWLRIGPGLVLAIVASVYVWVRDRPDLPVRSDWPSVERVPPAVTRPPRVPDVSDLLKHAEVSALTPRQRATIAGLVKEWQAESAERRREMDRAAAAFDDTMHKARSRGQGNLNEIYRSAAETSALTSEWLARKADLWQRGLAELTPSQRRRAIELLAKHPTRPEQPRGENEL